jgi:hypothetical protein
MTGGHLRGRAEARGMKEEGGGGKQAGACIPTPHPHSHASAHAKGGGCCQWAEEEGGWFTNTCGRVVYVLFYFVFVYLNLLYYYTV